MAEAQNAAGAAGAGAVPTPMPLTPACQKLDKCLKKKIGELVELGGSYQVPAHRADTDREMQAYLKNQIELVHDMIKQQKEKIKAAKAIKRGEARDLDDARQFIRGVGKKPRDPGAPTLFEHALSQIISGRPARKYT